MVRQKIKLQGERHIAYECLECGSLLLWLGDDLWLQADRWAYQKIGRSHMEHLLQRSMTADELRELAKRETTAPDDGKRAVRDHPPTPSWGWQPRRPEPRPEVRPAPPALVEPADAGYVAATSNQAATRAPEPEASPEEDVGVVEPSWVPERPRAWAYAAAPEPVYGPYQAWAEPQPVEQRRGRGSPFLLVSVALTLLCLICSSAAIIASTTFTGRTPLIIQPAQSPSVQAIPSQAPAVTQPGPQVVDAPVPTETPQPVPTEGSQPVPSEAAALQFQGVTEHVAATGTHYLVGEVLNTSASNLWFVRVLATFYDGGGQVIGGGETFTELSIVEAGSSAPFKLATLDPPPDLATYQLRFDYQTTDQAPLTLEIVDYSSFSDEEGGHHIVGDVRNDHVFAVKFPEIVATYYNASHEVIRVEMSLSQLNTIQPGETSPFEVVLTDPPPELHHYALHTEALRQ
jgi:hypothetical protein